MNIPWDKIVEMIVEKLTGMVAESFGEAIANRFKQNIRVEIAFGEFDTVFDTKQRDMMAWGDYFNSIGISDGKSSPDGNYEISVYSKDEKADDIEWGTSPNEEAGLTDEEVIAWARKVKAPNPEWFGRHVANAIRNKGQYPKKIFASAKNKTKTQNTVIKADGLILMRKKKANFSISGS